MKAITEFNVFNLKRAITLKGELSTQGKTPEEISTSIGESFKLEGDKLKAFVNSLDLVNDKTEGLKRVMVVTFAEGEAVPERFQKVDEQHFMLEYFQAPRPPAPKEEDGKRGGKGRGGPNRGQGGLRGGPKGKDGKGGPGKSADGAAAPKAAAKTES
jgi:hypothetical protein